ncbi:DinB family protein [Calidifontibacter sp. DB0510]|uniref:DinB family protein n=1 Tax=Metallococcus carri TaxID=1656884 RepID=A0A967B8Q8_9MICO|nr:DinB family protein [Metallococcus carri]NHN56876.1 DinB family protein [Metallococcus carri]NOP37621.1 DinB family protein [Calidifontibacter sp. DB2511S]
MTSERTEPPLSASEVEMLRGWLTFHRETLRDKASGLDSAGLNQTCGPSPITLGGLVKHMAYVEENWFVEVLDGEAAIAPWSEVDWSADEDWDWHSAADDTPEELFALWDRMIAESDRRLDAALRRGDLDQMSARAEKRSGQHFSLRWILVHMVEEYARHNGHADLVRESVDGKVGV